MSPTVWSKSYLMQKNRELLGCHICGAHAADLVQEIATSMQARLGVSAISSAVHAHPTSGEVVYGRSNVIPGLTGENAYAICRYIISTGSVGLYL